MEKINIVIGYEKLGTEEKEVSQNIDLDLMNFDIQNKVQELYDIVFVNGAQGYEEKAKLEYIYAHLQEVVRQGEKLLKREK